MERKFTFHLLGLAHLPTSRLYQSCAFTLKNCKLAKMLTSLGHEVYIYGVRTKEGEQLEDYVQSDKLHFIETHTVEEIAEDYGTGDNRFEIGYDWTNTDFKHDISDNQKKPSTTKFYEKAIAGIKQYAKPDHFLLKTQGAFHTPIADAVNLLLECESGIGYRGSVPGTERKLRFRAFESAYMMNYAYGKENANNNFAGNGNYYDRVIPNYFDDNDFAPKYEKGDYYLFIGRMIKRKGIYVAAMAAQAMGKKLIIVGQGAKVRNDGHLIPTEDPDFDLEPGTWEYLGYADNKMRKELMANAIATFTPTEYLEPFGGTHIESMLSGTPVLTTNFGVYPGTFQDGVGGYHCNSLDDFVYYGKELENWTPEQRKKTRKFAEKYLMDNVKWEFERWFDDLYNWYESATIPGATGWRRVRTEVPEWRSRIQL